MVFLSLSGLLARHPAMFYAATWTAVATAAVSVAAFVPELAFIWAVTPGTPLATACSPGGAVGLPLDGPPWDAVCVPAALFGRATLDVAVPLVFASAVVSSALWFTEAVGVWEEEEDADDADDGEGATMV
ncbi:hypothetical protein GUJ93_ZPchr0008g12018 [Zizania palustris]|uniref:Uncharacterized protein n=1 Tax=Zizania palustris TaxID=103762 RepID=A0A8J5VJ26_ZIZPA|nr:hypothetical protein GUJ93_ZPchr0008g12018 [Zizania palustris]